MSTSAPTGRAKQTLPTPSGSNHKLYSKGAATRNRVIEAAEECIVELGFNRTSSREITRRSGVTFGVIQYHFGTYEAVLLAVVERAAAGLSLMLETAEITGATTREKVESIVDIVWSYYERPQYLSYIEIYLNLSKDPATSEQTVQSLHVIDDEIERLWHGLVMRVFGGSDDEIAMQRLLFGAMRGMAVSRWLNEGRLDFRQERGILVAMISDHIDTSRAAGT